MSKPFCEECSVIKSYLKMVTSKLAMETKIEVALTQSEVL